MTAPGPLAVQELVDYCIDFLHTSRADLKACALVSRSWAQTSQMHLFNRITIGASGYTYGDPTFLAATRLRCRQLCGLLTTSPKHSGWIESIHIYIDTTPPDTLVSFTSLEFPHLRKVAVLGNWLEGQGSVLDTVRELLSRRTLTALSISGNFRSFAAFMQILERCSEGITNVSLCNIRIPSFAPVMDVDVRSSGRRVKIDTLDIWWSDSIKIWLNSPQCPFDFSNLRSLRLNENTSLPEWEAFAPSIPHVEYLQFQPLISAPGLTNLNLAAFTNLKCVEIFVEYNDDIAEAFTTLSTIACPNQIRTIRFRLPHTCLPKALSGAEIDRQILALPLPHLTGVELVYPTRPPAGMAAHLPLLNEQDL
ncbi:hypothetical protein B0H11DRAFT_2107272 [Mycena galericulata]|nr:hypothetical protein B0H11DRAFT_2116064 [Mycena galericulata]KAJ7437468.1 hypothetical protein B0H11DRAFT_2107272 [Mycena galericulata]